MLQTGHNKRTFPVLCFLTPPESSPTPQKHLLIDKNCNYEFGDYARAKHAPCIGMPRHPSTTFTELLTHRGWVDLILLWGTFGQHSHVRC